METVKKGFNYDVDCVALHLPKKRRVYHDCRPRPEIKLLSFDEGVVNLPNPNPNPKSKLKTKTKTTAKAAIRRPILPNPRKPPQNPTTRRLRSSEEETILSSFGRCPNPEASLGRAAAPAFRRQSQSQTQGTDLLEAILPKLPPNPEALLGRGQSQSQSTDLLDKALAILPKLVNPPPNPEDSPRRAAHAAELKARFAATIFKAHHGCLFNDSSALKKKVRERQREAAGMQLLKVEEAADGRDNMEIFRELEALSGTALHYPCRNAPYALHRLGLILKP